MNFYYKANIDLIIKFPTKKKTIQFSKAWAFKNIILLDYYPLKKWKHQGVLHFIDWEQWTSFVFI